MENETPFETRCEILAELWVNYKDSDNFADFITYNDLGLPIAYAISTQIVTATPKAEMFVNETWNLLLEGFGVEDIGYDSLDDLLKFAE